MTHEHSRQWRTSAATRSRHRLLSAGLVLAVALNGCGQSVSPPSEPADVSRPAQIVRVSAATLDSDLRFPGRVRAVQRVELAFNVPGQIIELPVTEGERVAAGALLAQLDPTAYETALAVARAELDAASAEYERVRQLWEKSQAVARAEVERKRTAMDVARSRFAAAQQDLDDTRLSAPFAGVVARRLAENFQNVQAKEPVLSLQNPDALEIVIHVPERVVRSEPRRVAGSAVFADLPQRRFPVVLKSFATEADPQTQTYEVVLGLTRPPDLRVLPGMAVEVLPQSAALGAETARPVAGGADTAQAGTDRPAADPTDSDPADTGRADTTGPEGDAGTDERQPGTEQSASSRPAPPASPAPTTSVLIPLAAIVAAADGTPTVWVVDPQTSEVSQRAIETGAVQGGEVAVLSGLTPGEQIVTAGVHHLRAGMRVHPLAPRL